MKSTSAPSNQPAGDNNNDADADAGTGNQANNSSITDVSYFQKTICLQDWWLIKVDTDGEGEKLGVAGFTSREQPALRLFSSAPVAKYYGMCTLETMDGICVILNGLINKSRTLENGFPPEVFTYFVMGFPPYWELYAENCFRRGSAADVVSRGSTSLSRGIPENSCKSFGDSRHIDSENLNKGVEDRVDMIPETGQHDTAFNESSEPKFNNASGLNSKALRNSKNLVDVVIVEGTPTESAPPETSSINNDSSCAINKSLLVEPNCIGTGRLESTSASKRSGSYDKDNPLNVDGTIYSSSATGITEKVSSPVVEYSNNLELSGNLLAVDGSSLASAVEGVNDTECSPIVENSHPCADDSNSQHKVLSELRNVASTNINVDVNVSIETTERHNCELENLRGRQKESASTGYGATTPKSRTRRSAANASFGNREKENPNNKSLNLPGDVDEAAIHSEGRISTRHGKSQRKQVVQKSSRVLEDERNKLNRLPAGSSDQTANVDAGLDSKSRHRKSGVATKAKKAGRSTSKLGVADRKDCSKIAVTVKEKVTKDRSISGKKIKRKLTYESPVKQGKEEEASIVPIDSLSCKRSRSGRLLLPSLEFWRNQTLVYDSDGRIAGIKEDPCTGQPSRGSKSEPPRKKSKLLAKVLVL